MRRKVVLSLSIIVIMGSIIAIGNRPVHNLIEYDKNTTLALFNEDGSKIDKVPSKDSGYTLDTEKSSCTNGSISWDTKSWSPVITAGGEVKGRVSCTLYFKEVTAYDECVMEYGTDSINCQIIAELDEDNCPNVNEDGSVNINSIEAENAYVCSAPDDYGTSYYYRGNVNNNYVYFAGFYWRIIRINGDGSIRMIYDGTSTHANGEETTDKQIGKSYYNYYWKRNNIEEVSQAKVYNDNAAIGYMYGNRDSITGMTTSKEQAQENINDSTIKDFVDSWYEENLLGTEDEQYLADTLFCNDRTILTPTPSDYYTTLGYGNNNTAYRWYISTSVNTDRVFLTCQSQNDRFTVDDEVTGNGDLTYPIALLTTDEAITAGAYKSNNTSYYLHSGQFEWTMTPGRYEGLAQVNYIQRVSYVGMSISVNAEYAVRPVINLKPNSLASGDGTANNPYMVI